MTRTAETIAADIRNWDTVSINDLLIFINELNDCRDEYGYQIDTQNYVEMAALPSAAIPDDIDTAYPVWAVDQDGYALVGDDASRVETLDQIRSAIAAAAPTAD